MLRGKGGLWDLVECRARPICVSVGLGCMHAFMVRADGDLDMDFRCDDSARLGGAALGYIYMDG